MAMKCRDACKPKPRLRWKGEIQRPNRDATRNAHSEIDLSDDSNWVTVGEVWFALRQRRAMEIIAVDQVEGTRFVEIQAWGTATTRESCDSPHWRLVYSDMDGRSHTLNFEPGKVEDDGRWVVIPAIEKV